MSKFKYYICIYWLGEDMPYNVVTYHAEDGKSAEQELKRHLQKLAGRGNWQYLVTEKQVSGSCNTACKVAG